MSNIVVNVQTKARVLFICPIRVIFALQFYLIYNFISVISFTKNHNLNYNSSLLIHYSSLKIVTMNKGGKVMRNLVLKKLQKLENDMKNFRHFWKGCKWWGMQLFFASTGKKINKVNCKQISARSDIVLA